MKLDRRHAAESGIQKYGYFSMSKLSEQTASLLLHYKLKGSMKLLRALRTERKFFKEAFWNFKYFDQVQNSSNVYKPYKPGSFRGSSF